MNTWLDKHKTAALLNCHPNSLPRYRCRPAYGWIEGCHWTRLGGKILYNRELLLDWLANRNDLDAHLRAIETFQSTLLSNQRRKKA